MLIFAMVQSSAPQRRTMGNVQYRAWVVARRFLVGETASGRVEVGIGYTDTTPATAEEGRTSLPESTTSPGMSGVAFANR